MSADKETDAELWEEIKELIDELIKSGIPCAAMVKGPTEEEILTHGNEAITYVMRKYCTEAGKQDINQHMESEP